MLFQVTKLWTQQLQAVSCIMPRLLFHYKIKGHPPHWLTDKERDRFSAESKTYTHSMGWSVNHHIRNGKRSYPISYQNSYSVGCSGSGGPSAASPISGSSFRGMNLLSNRLLSLNIDTNMLSSFSSTNPPRSYNALAGGSFNLHHACIEQLDST